MGKEISLTSKRLRVPFILATTLFFMWGFARNILGVLNKHFQDVFQIGVAQSSKIEVCTFLGYFLMALPAGWFVARYGYKRTMVVGLCIFALGCLSFVPCASVGYFSWHLLLVFFIIACGLVFLEVSANPYVTQLGPVETSSARLNLAQSFNGLGGILAPLIAGSLLLHGGTGADAEADVALPYSVMGIFVAVIAVVFMVLKLPEKPAPVIVAGAEETESSWHLGKAFWCALIALLAYEVAEICINSYFIIYTTGQGWLGKVEASSWLSGGMLLFMCGRLVGSWLMQRVAAKRILLFCSLGTVLCVSAILLEVGSSLSLTALLLNFLFESIMFPTIYSMALQGLSYKQTSRAGSILMMTPVGGCSFLLMGMLADQSGLTMPFFLPLAGFAVVMLYALWANVSVKRN